MCDPTPWLHPFPLSGGMSLAFSGLVSVGRLIPEGQRILPGTKSKGSGRGEVDETSINLHLLPTNKSPQDTFGAHCANRKDKEGEVDIQYM